ncbi:S-adenosyl-L-methionine-dependent methyltransferase [Xylariaceae sp. FL0804]|nr:S-adenosyl-L-methionine-dependent methyltransferase [Xylariaceae sp. FL0804]
MYHRLSPKSDYGDGNPSLHPEDFLAAAQSVLASNDDETRKSMFGTAMRAVAMLESPLDTPHAPAALMTLMKAGVIQEIARAETPLMADELARSSGANRLLIVRFLQPLNAVGIVMETSPETYGTTHVTKMLQDRALLGGSQFMYLERTGVPGRFGRAGPFEDTHGTAGIGTTGGGGGGGGGGLFAWLARDPAMLANFQALMSGQRADRQQWFDFFRTSTACCFQGNARAADDDDDEDGDDDDDVLAAPGAGYYFRPIFHGPPDADCVRIRENLLMSEFVLPASDTPLYPALLGINMMGKGADSVLNSTKKTEAQLSRLRDAAGLKVVKF